MTQTRMDSPKVASGPNSPPPQEPTHDVPVYPEHDPPPGQESAMAAHEPGGSEDEQPIQGAEPSEGQEDVDEDDLDPRVQHSPPDAGKRDAAHPDADRQKVIFDENMMAG